MGSSHYTLVQHRGHCTWIYHDNRRVRLHSGFKRSHLSCHICCRQRSVCISTHAEIDPSPITIRDFNPYSVARYTQPEPDKETDQNAGIRRLVTEATVLEPRHVFTEHVWSALPYVEVASRQRYDYTAVLMDEERILGLRVCALLPLFCI